jgi:hypothetical protein
LVISTILPSLCLIYFTNCWSNIKGHIFVSYKWRNGQHIERKELNVNDSFLAFMCFNVVNIGLLFFNLPYHYFFLTEATSANSLVYFASNVVCLLYSVHIWNAWQNIWDKKISCKCN